MSVIVIIWFKLVRKSDLVRKSPENPADVVALSASAIVGLMLWLLVPTVYLMVGNKLQKGEKLDANDQVVMSVGAPLIAWAALMIMLKLAEPGLLGRLGLGFKNLLRGAPRGLFGLLLAMPFVIITLQLAQFVWTRIQFQHPDKHQLLEVLSQSPNEFWLRIGVNIAAIACAPLFEELFFRGVIQTTLRKVTGYPILAILGSSVVFTLIHATWTWPPIFVLALFLGMTYEKTRNLWAVTIMHAAFNATAILLQ